MTIIDDEADKLSRLLASIYSQIKRDLRIVLPAGRVSWYDITRDYKPRADDAITSSVEEIYRLSAKQITERKFKQPFFTTELDRQQIRQLTIRYRDWYWTGLENEIIRKTARAFDPRTLMRFDPSNIKLKDAFIDRAVTSLSTEVAARAVISKTRQILMTATQINTFVRSQQYLVAAMSGPRFIWRTATAESLCPQCQELKGRTWSIGDPNILMPVISTHISCRCKLELLI